MDGQSFSHMKKYGVVQGRLAPRVGDFIQSFPENWLSEFEILKHVGGTHIEWIYGAPGYPFNDDPLLNLDVNLAVNAVCADVILDPTRSLVGFATLVHDVIALIKRTHVKMLVLPLLERQSLVSVWTGRKRGEIIDTIKSFAISNPDISFSIESDLDADDVLSLLDDINQHNVNVTFDTGNLTKLGYDLHKHIDLYGAYIDNVHVKDCLVGGSTVQLGTGNTDLSVFKRVKMLSSVKYLTFQTARSPGPTEIETFRHNVMTMDRVMELSDGVK